MSFFFFDMWQVTPDRWHLTCDTWHVTPDTWHVTRDMFGVVNILSKFHLPNSYRLWFMILWRSGGKGWLNQWINELINDKAVYRTAPATSGLLKKLDGVGPVDNRPSNDKFDHFVRKKIK